jgi:hypothetical protein
MDIFKDTCNGIGSHSLASLSTTNFDSNEFTIYPNPSSGNVK